MKPDDLKPPFPKNDRKVTICDRVWYMPDPYLANNKFEFSGWAHPTFFGNTNPVCIEYCSGNGTWIAAQAQANPHFNWVAVERKFTRVRKIWSKIKNLNLPNLLVICGEAFRTTHCYFPGESTSDIYINFPDPWPKTRHAKHRLIQPLFVQELARIIQKGRSLTFVTDDPTYSQEVIDLFLANSNFKSYYPQPYFSLEENNYGTSFFDELWRSKGRSIRYHKFIKQ